MSEAASLVQSTELSSVAEYVYAALVAGGRRGWNRMVDSLRARGMLREDPLGLGVDLDADGRLRDTGGLSARSLYAVGSARRGSAQHVAAIPDIRRQAATLAHHVCHETVSIDELAS